MQLSADPLLPIERIAIGGIDTVRGYRENELVVDSGWITSAELRIPLGQADGAGVERRRPTTAPCSWCRSSTPAAAGTSRRRTPRRTSSTRFGAGLRWQPNRRLDLRLDFAPPLVDLPTPEEDDLQDLALYFELVTRFY